MTPPVRYRPVGRGRVLVGGLGLFVLVGAILLTGEQLRHPHPPAAASEEQIVGSDPREAAACPQPNPREGAPRETPDMGLVADVTSNSLYDCPHVYDGQRVRYRGEVVGALLRRDSGVWTQLNDDVYAGSQGPLPAHRDFRGGNAGVGVLLSHELAAQVTFVGGPRTRGDVVEIVGRFNRVDPAGEVAVIRADSGYVASSGALVPDPPLPDRRIAAIIAVVVAAIVVVAERVATRQR